VIERKRKQNGRYYLLGSVNPVLIKHISESLAGRVGIVELTPFLYSEISDLKIDLTVYWLKGGFPDALKEKNASKWQRWQENYIRTFIERDIPKYTSVIRVSCITFWEYPVKDPCWNHPNAEAVGKG
jgi:predicted AAA+ superfamily ATPase